MDRKPPQAQSVHWQPVIVYRGLTIHDQSLAQEGQLISQYFLCMGLIVDSRLEQVRLSLAHKPWMSPQ